MAIHGNKSQTARTRALADFKSGELRVLVATDIAARGIDIDQLPHVVNFELPNVPEDYVHRIGRTGRAGASGEAISLVCVDEELFLRDIQQLIHREIPREVIRGFEPDPNERAEPIVLGRMTIGVRGPRGAAPQGGRPGGRPGGGSGGGGRPPRQGSGAPPRPAGRAPQPPQARTGQAQAAPARRPQPSPSRSTGGSALTHKPAGGRGSRGGQGR
jgi:ATP-dependent RNA helicase RhlE